MAKKGTAEFRRRKWIERRREPLSLPPDAQAWLASHADDPELAGLEFVLERRDVSSLDDDSGDEGPTAHETTAHETSNDHDPRVRLAKARDAAIAEGRLDEAKRIEAQLAKIGAELEAIADSRIDDAERIDAALAKLDEEVEAIEIDRELPPEKWGKLTASGRQAALRRELLKRWEERFGFAWEDRFAAEGIHAPWVEPFAYRLRAQRRASELHAHAARWLAEERSKGARDDKALMEKMLALDEALAALNDAREGAGSRARRGAPALPRLGRKLGPRAFVIVWDVRRPFRLPDRPRVGPVPPPDRPHLTSEEARVVEVGGGSQFLSVQELTWASLLAGNWPKVPRQGRHVRPASSVLAAEREAIKTVLRRDGLVPIPDPERKPRVPRRSHRPQKLK